jgi:hypothetical protein
LPNHPLTITPDHAAERLSRLLWAQRPDAALLSRSANLRTSADVQAMARIMLQDARVEASARALMRKWLHLDAVELRLGPTELAQPFGRETNHFVTRLLISEDASLLTLLTAQFTFVDRQEVSLFYGGGGITPVGVSKIMMDPVQRRSGILTHASVLSAYPQAPARGVWLRQALLCQDIPAPPPQQPVLPEPTAPPSTYRQRLTTAVSSNAACVGCHTLIDQPGFALERYDASGRFRETDDGLPIDSTGRLIGFDGASELVFNDARTLGEGLFHNCAVQACAVQNFMQFALGELRPADVPSRVEVAAAFAHSGFNLRELLIAITGSKAFLAP